MTNSTVTLQQSVPASSGVNPMGFSTDADAIAVQVTNYGPGILAIGDSSFTSISNTSNAVLVYPGQVSPIFYDSDVTSNSGTPNLRIASLGDVAGESTEYGSTWTILG